MAALDDLVDNVLAAARAAGPSPFAYGTVHSVGAGTPPVVTVDWNGSTVPALCPKHFTTSDIAVGDTVVMTQPPQLLILQVY
jgi:hypothetical protein